MSSGFSFGAPSTTLSQQPAVTFSSSFGNTQPNQPVQQAQSAPVFSFGAPATNTTASSTPAGAPVTAPSTESVFKGFGTAVNKPTVTFAGFGQPTSTNIATPVGPTNNTTDQQPVASGFNTQTNPVFAAPTTSTSTVAFSFGKSQDQASIAQPDANKKPVTNGPQPETNARLVELEGKKVSDLLDDLRAVLLKDIDAANKNANSMISQEADIELLEEDMKQFSDKITYVQQKQMATEESLRKLYELQCNVLDIVKKIENYNQYSSHPLTHAINTVENSIISLEQSLLSSSFINRDILDVFQGLQKQISIISMLEAET